MRFALGFVLVLLLGPVGGVAQTFPRPVSPFVNDFANVLGADPH